MEQYCRKKDTREDKIAKVARVCMVMKCSLPPRLSLPPPEARHRAYAVSVHCVPGLVSDPPMSLGKPETHCTHSCADLDQLKLSACLCISIGGVTM